MPQRLATPPGYSSRRGLVRPAVNCDANRKTQAARLKIQQWLDRLSMNSTVCRTVTSSERATVAVGDCALFPTWTRPTHAACKERGRR